MSSDLLLTRDSKNNLIGGGYTLNSSFLNSNIPAFTHTRAHHSKSGGKGRRNAANAESGSGSDSESESDANAIPAKVSDIFERANGKNALVIPAGIFMIHSSSSSSASASADGAPMKTKLKELLYYGSDSSDSSDSSDESDSKTQVVPDDLYEKLLGLVSPSHVNRYWDPKSSTRKKKLTTKSKTRNRRHK